MILFNKLGILNNNTESHSDTVLNTSMRYAAILLGFWLMLLTMGLPVTAHSATYYVGTTTDENDGGDCTNASNTDCSLRDAVAAASSNGGTDTVQVPAGSYVLSLGQITSNNGLLNVVGAGAGSTTIDGNNASRIFETGWTTAGMSFTDITLTKGNAGTSADGGCVWMKNQNITVTDSVFSYCSARRGGAIYSDQTITVTVEGSTFNNNTAANTASNGGGAIQAKGVTITNSTFTSNTATNASGRGGAIYSPDTISVTGSTFSNNQLTTGGQGGAIFALSTTTINTSTFSSNSNASGQGGAIHINNAGTTATITDSTFNNNTATGDGGAINTLEDITIDGSTFNGNSTSGGLGGAIARYGNVTVTNSTFSGNSSNSGGGAIRGGNTTTIKYSTFYNNSSNSGNSGGAVLADSLTTEGSIYTANTSNSVADHCGWSGKTSTGYNIDHGGYCGFTPTTGDVTTDPLLQALADNGGPTQTHAVTSGPAVDGGPATCTAATGDVDQRDTARPQGTNCDIGAYEYAAGGGNNAPFGGYTADDVIPTAQVTQSSNGNAIITISFRAKDADGDSVTLNTFQYSVNGGTDWNAPTNGDSSGSLSTDWDDGGSSYSTSTDWSGTVHSFTFDTDHTDVTGISGTDQSDIQIRFTVNDSTDDSAAAATSQSFQVDDLAPTATITSAEYSAHNDTLVITGTNFTTIAAATTDIKSYVDWTKFVWDINADDATTANITFAEGDVTSLTVTDATTLTLVFTTAKGSAIEATSGYGSTGGADSLDVTAGFSKDVVGNAAATDAVADGTLTIAPFNVCASGCTFTTIQEAINASSNGNTITVENGTYSENIDFSGKLITLVSENGAANTKIQGTGAADAVVTFDSGETASTVLDGFTIDNQGSGASARGIKITSSSSPTIQNCVIEGNVLSTVTNSDPNWGAGIYINGGGATISSTTIGQSGTANQANKGSGIYATTGSDISISNSTISYNSGRDYAGIYLSSMTGTTTLTSTNVDNNTANGYTVGGIYANASSLSITGGSISNNSGTSGAGLRLENVPTVTTINNVALNSNNAGATIAGGIYSIDSPITISNGTTVNSNISRDGAGIYLSGNYSGFAEGTKTTIDNTTIDGNNAQGYSGGGVYSNSSPIEITNSTITNNSGAAGSGLRLVSVPIVTVITNTSINSNTGTATPGGGVYSDSSPMTITGGTISSNTGSRSGGGIYLTGSYASFDPGTKTTISGTTINGNDSSGYAGGGIYSNGLLMAFSGGATISNNTGSSGAGIYLYNISDTTSFNNVTVTGNTASAGNNGGGLVANEAPIAISNSTTFSSNTSGRSGAAIYITGTHTSTDTIADSTIKNNTENENYGGGAIYTNMKLQIDRSYILGNRGSSGAGLYATNNLTVTNSSITGNVADRSTTNDGGGIYAGGTTTIMNCTIAGNYAGDDGGGIYTNGDITNTILWGNTAGDAVLKQYAGSPTITYSDIEGSGGGGTNFDADPVFVNFQQASAGSPTDAGDFHLQITSPMIDEATGTGAPADDIDGDTRYAGTGDDIGADEFSDNFPPYGGYTADNVIPAAQVTQSTNGDAVITINFRVKDNDSDNTTLNTFQYSINGGTDWNAPTNGDSSGSLSANWNNGGSSYSSAADWSGTVHSFTFDTDHADVTGISGTDQSDIQVRFTVNDGTDNSGSPATSEDFQVDDVIPTVTITSASYNKNSDTLTITGTNFTTIAAASTDIKSYVDWTKFIWDINGDGATTADITFVIGDVTSLSVTNATTLTLVFTGAKGTAIEATSGYGSAGGEDTLDVTAGFSKDAVGNTATTDAVSDGTLTTNTAPFGGYSADNVIPAAQVTQSSNGDGIITINFRVKDGQADTTTLNTFEYSVNGGSGWSAPTNGDSSNSLSTNWNNGGSSYSSATDWTGTVHSFTFDTNHADVSGMDGIDQSDVQVRFTVNDGALDSAAAATSQNFEVDNVAPIATITSSAYTPSTDTLVVTGANFTTVADAATDVKSYLDWSKFVWDINGDNATTANVTFVEGDISSATITNATTLTIVFTSSKGTSIEGTTGYGVTGGDDTLDVTAGFSIDAAGNAASTDTAADATLSTPVISYTVTKTADTNDGTCDADCSLREAVAAANALADLNTIDFDLTGTFTLTGSAGEDSNASGDLDIVYPVTISGDGPASTIISGNNGDRIFHFQASASGSQIDNVKIMNGEAGTLNGGCVYSPFNLTITGSTLDNCKAQNAGGAIYTTGATLTDVTITNSYSDITGGAIYNITNVLTINGTSNTFSYNYINNGTHTNDYGGHIWSDADVTISNSTFTGRTSTSLDAYVAGAIYMNGTTHTLNITNSTFDSFRTNLQGGAIVMTGGTFTDVTFTNNYTATKGGAIYNTTSPLTINGTGNTFSSNYIDNGTHTNDFGGHIYSDADLTISNSTFTGRGTSTLSAYEGGAIYMNGTTHTLNITNSTFDLFYANSKGGTLRMSGGTLTDVDITNSRSNAWGGAIANFTNALTINVTSGTNTFSGSWTDNGTAASDLGGHIYSDADLTVEDTVFTGRGQTTLSSYWGGAIYMVGSTHNLIVTRSTFDQFYASSTGGAIYMSGGTLTDVDITNGRTNAWGGAIYNHTNAMTLTVSSGTNTFSNNYVDNGTLTSDLGGHIYSDADLTVTDTVFTGRTGLSYDAYWGGAIYMVDGGGHTLTVSDSTFDEFYALSRGGAIYTMGGTLTNITVTNSISGAWGGAIANVGGSLTINGTSNTFTGNYSTNGTHTSDLGGSIYSNAALNVSNATFTGQSDTSLDAYQGGAIYATSTLTISDSTFEDYDTNNVGGAVYAGAGFSITDSTFTSNKTKLGGAVYNTGGAGNLYGANTFTSNWATGASSNAGGCIYSNAQAITINDAGSTFTSNRGDGSGGCLWVSSTLNINAATTFEGNYSTTNNGGGAIISQGGTMTDVTFKDNYADDYGGAFFPLAAYTINNCTFEGNYLTSSSGGGGALYLKAATYTVTVNNSTFVGNYVTGTGQGGAIFTNTNAYVNLYNSTLYNNTAGGSAQALRAVSSGRIRLYNSIISHPTSAALCSNTANAGNDNIEYNNSGTACAAATNRDTSDPKLSALADNGGPTKTMALQSGSPAIDSSGTSATTSDQRGVSAVSTRDIGAFEYEATNTAPFGGYTANNVIPTAQVTQSSDGDAVMTINFRAKDIDGDNVTLNTFEYSVNGGTDWNAPTNGDSSGSLAANWNNGGSSYSSATDWSGTVHSFTFDADHSDVTGISGTDQSDIQIRFTVNDSTVDSTSPATSESFQVDDLAPTATITSATYNAATDTMVVTGTNFTTIADAATDIKSYVDWAKFVWDINGDGATTADVTFAEGDVTSLTVTDATTLTLVLTGAKGTALEGTAEYGATGGADTLDITAGFSKDAAGNAATTDARADGAISLPQAMSGTVYTDGGVTTIADGATIRLIINGASAGTDTTSSGAYSISALVDPGDAMIVYIDDHATDATTVTITDGNALTDLNLYGDHVVVRHDNGGSLTNANMTTALGAYSDTEILYTTDGSDNLTVSGSASELYVWAGDTYAPGADIDTVHMHIAGILDAAGNTINLSGSWEASAGSTLTSTGTLTLDGTTDQTLITGSKWITNLTINNTGATGDDDIFISGALGVTSTFTFTDGNLDISTNDPAIYMQGDVTIANGTSIDISGRTDGTLWYFDGTTTYTDNNATPVDLKDVAVKDSGDSITLASDMKIRTLDIRDGTSFNMGSNGYVLEVYGTGNKPASGGGTFNRGTNSKVKYTGTGTTTTITGTAYHHLEIAPTSATTFLLDSSMETSQALSGDLIIGANATFDTQGNNMDASTGSISNDGVFKVQGGETLSGTMDSNSGTVLYYGTGSYTELNWGDIYYNLTFDTASGSWTLDNDLTVNNDLNVTDGIVDTNSGSSYAVTVNGNFIETVDSRVLANSSLFTITGDFTANANNSDPESQDFNNASLVFNGAGSSINYDNLFGNWAYGFYNLTVGQGGVTDTLYDTLAVRNLLTIGSGALVNSGTVDIYLTSSGDVLSFNAAANLDITTLYFNNSGSINLPPLNNGYDCNIGLASNGMTLTQTGDVTLNSDNLYIDGNGFTDRAATYNTGGYTLTVGGSLIIGNSGDTATKTLTATNSTINVAGNFTINHSSNVFTSTNSTVVLNGTADQTITSNGRTFHNLTLNNTGTSGNDDIIIADALDINGTATMTDGDLDIGTNDPTVNTAGDVTIANDGSIDVTGRTANWTFDGTTTLTDSSSGGPQDLEDVVLNGTSLTLASNAKLQTMTITVGTLNLGSSGYILEIDGTGTPLSNSGTFTAGTSTIKYTGSGTATDITSLPYSSLQLTPSGTTTYSLTGHLTGGNAMTGNLTIDTDATLDAVSGSNYNLTVVDVTINGTYTAQGSTITLSGDWDNNGTLTAGTSSVVFDGSNQQLYGSATFYDLTKTVTSADTLTFEAGETTTIATGGTVTLNGASDELLTLASSTGSSAWNLNVESGATKDIDYVSVSWSDASGSHSTQKPIAPTNSTDGNNNTDWFSSATPVITVTKMSLTISDPVNSGTNPKSIPGAVIEYSVTPSNSGDGSPDANSTYVTDVIDTDSVKFDYTTGVSFTDGTTSSALSLGTVTYSDDAAPGPYTYDYTPTADGDGCDANITSIKVTTSGTFANGGAPAPSFTLKYRVKVK